VEECENGGVRLESTVTLFCGIALLAGLAPGAAAQTAQNPIETIDGLQAWYTVRSLHEYLRNGETVGTWEDSSGNGRDLKSDDRGRRALFYVNQLNGKPSVAVTPTNGYTVAKPFRLDDHTIFLVYGAAYDQCALFQSSTEGEDGVGIVLGDKDNRDAYQSGPFRIYANKRPPPTRDYVIKVLGRRSGVLHSFVDGDDYSSRKQFRPQLGVGRFFRLSYSRAVRKDGKGLGIAEMIIFDRYLRDSERSAVTRHLAEWYGIELAKGAEVRPPEEHLVRARLGTEKEQNVNVTEPTAISWEKQIELKSPLRHDAGSDRSKLYSTEDDTHVRLYVSLTLRSSTPGAAVRALLLKNEEEYLDEEGRTGSMSGDPAEGTIVRFAANLTLAAGDYVEVVTLGEGEPGAVTLDPAGSEFVAELD
jgi:hypothetical protein